MFFCSDNLVTRGQQPNLVTGVIQRTVLMAAPASICDQGSDQQIPQATGSRRAGEATSAGCKRQHQCLQTPAGHRTTEDGVSLFVSKVCPIQHCKNTVAAGRSSREGARTWAEHRPCTPGLWYQTTPTHGESGAPHLPWGADRAWLALKTPCRLCPVGLHVCRAQCDSSTSHPTSQGSPEH